MAGVTATRRRTNEEIREQCGQARAFVYRPNDGQAYVWDGFSFFADVLSEDLSKKAGVVAVSGVIRSAESFMRRVDSWRLNHRN